MEAVSQSNAQSESTAAVAGVAMSPIAEKIDRRRIRSEAQIKAFEKCRRIGVERSRAKREMKEKITKEVEERLSGVVTRAVAEPEPPTAKPEPQPEPRADDRRSTQPPRPDDRDKRSESAPEPTKPVVSLAAASRIKFI
jgi:hypothetical protein